MFLRLLEEKNKQKFIALCGLAADSDGVFDEKEEETIYTYCREMNIPEVLPDNSDSLEILLNDLNSEAGVTEKKIILFEILGLMLSDSEFAEREQEFVQKIVEKFGIDKQELAKICSLLEIYKTVFKELYMAVCR